MVAAGFPGDPARPDAAAFLEAALTEGSAVHQPTLTLVEVSAAVARRTGDETLAMEAGAAVLSIPGLVLHPLDLAASADASAIAARLHLRAADAVYAATAARRASTLVTLDEELLARAGSVVDAVTPAGWLARRR